MSGHSKWSTIKHQKEANDKARGQAFSKLSRAITVAVREGGGETDPEANYKLRVAIDRARGVNMPKSNIQRAIDRALGGEEEVRLESIRFEGYAPFGVGVIIEAITDNRQRTVQEIKNLIEKGGGSIASPGSVSYNFMPKGQVILNKIASVEDQMLAIMDIDGVEDLFEEEEFLEVVTDKNRLSQVLADIEKAGFEIKSASLVMVPKTEVPITDPGKAQKVVNFVERLEDQEDVQAVFANFDIPSKVLKQFS